jgi:hypothetical protein
MPCVACEPNERTQVTLCLLGSTVVSCGGLDESFEAGVFRHPRSTQMHRESHQLIAAAGLLAASLCGHEPAGDGCVEWGRRQGAVAGAMI